MKRLEMEVKKVPDDLPWGVGLSLFRMRDKPAGERGGGAVRRRMRRKRIETVGKNSSKTWLVFLKKVKNYL